ncbi:peptide ABC transporter substrate-binding protein [Thermanaerothrix sp.]|jgi:peptide/nickel transport system substrate-binding protein|uniref:peptide ABC transporter substrate-binding protein n=1 Tax=Thermanaerothrix sp. TaxID=2972675 RepID=UPI002ADE2750|nr:peptide ABC transporter substrate-binding protein [Thermanaerothrix sp.]
MPWTWPGFRQRVSVWLILVLILTACQTAGGTTAKSPPTVAATVVPTQAPTPTQPPKILSVCLGEEPRTLYIYGGNSRSMWNILEAIYDGPVDWVNGQPKPVILERLPTRDNGDVVEERVTVQAGDEVVNTEGQVVPLEAGVRVFPGGCRDEGCAQTWDGKAPLEMARLRITFHLRSGVTWSDGQPLTAEDSVYSYRLAADPKTPTSKFYVDRTAEYQALDAQTVLWVGKPGYVPHDNAALFFIPLPQHAWSNYTAEALLSAEVSTKSPLGWGPYVIETWQPGEVLRVRRNPNYFRAKEGLPKFDIVEFRFLGEQADNNLYALLHGTCDIVDRTVLLESQLKDVLEAEKAGQIRLWRILGPTWEHLDFGIRPAAYDAGYSPLGAYRQDLFGDVRVRQAFAYCLDRERVNKEIFLGQNQVPVGFYPSDDPRALSAENPYPYDPQRGQQLLETVGWIDDDANPSTPRVAQGVPNVRDGTPLMVTYLTTNAPLRQKVAAILAESLRGCGIGVNVQFLDLGEFYAPGPEGPLFGRKFDLAALSWQSGEDSPCFLYLSNQIPDGNNHWLGVNLSGFSDPEYDRLCREALNADPNEAEAYQTAQRAVQAYYLQALPSVPLYFSLDLVAGRADVCGLAPDRSGRSDVWNLEVLDRQPNCP